MASLLSEIVPETICTSEMELGAEPDAFFPGEAAIVERAIQKRRHEFQMGRSCARRALGKLGVAPVAVLSNEDRSPSWPSGVVGSITHTGGAPEGWCGAAVGKAQAWVGIGIDAELRSPLNRELWGRVLRPSEVHFLNGLPSQEAGLLAKIFFSAKEAFYKCQYPITLTFLGFQAVQVVFDVARAEFETELMLAELPPDVDARSLQLLSAIPRLVGRYASTPALILSSVCWAKSADLSG